MPQPAPDFAARLIAWHADHGRHDLPWQNTHDPYRIWLSEIMLQQTQVDTVVPYYRRFLARCPDIATLAAADSGTVMALWSGLGYYARARNLHACAQRLVADHGGAFPATAEAIATLPGIGRSTAAAIAAFAFGERTAILDGNVKRVLCRAFGIDGFPGQAAVERKLWALAEALLPHADVATYIQAQMDLGATLCTRGTPHCTRCPLATCCVAHATGRTAALPTPRPRKALPLRRITALVIRHRDAVLLLKRPPHGIWGGLLSLPELAPDTAPAAWLAELLAAAPAQPLPPLRHTFTHFMLDIQPLLLSPATRPDAVPSTASWQPVDALDAVGLPAPVRRILVALQPAPGASKPR